MAERSFHYQKHVGSPDSKHPLGRPCLRPYLHTEFGLNGLKSPIFPALVDTGADRCYFPLAYARLIGLIEDSDDPQGFTTGAGDDNIPTFYRDVLVNVEDLCPPWTIRAAFSARFDRLKSGVLGGLGFFDRFAVRFDMPSGIFHVTIPDGPSTPH
jgi:hypothetical protein